MVYDNQLDNYPAKAEIHREKQIKGILLFIFTFKGIRHIFFLSLSKSNSECDIPLL